MRRERGRRIRGLTLVALGNGSAELRSRRGRRRERWPEARTGKDECAGTARAAAVRSGVGMAGGAHRDGRRRGDGEEGGGGATEKFGSLTASM